MDNGIISGTRNAVDYMKNMIKEDFNIMEDDLQHLNSPMREEISDPMEEDLELNQDESKNKVEKISNLVRAENAQQDEMMNENIENAQLEKAFSSDSTKNISHIPNN